MGTIVGILAVLVILIFLFLVGGGCSCSTSPEKNISTTTGVSAEGFDSLDREAIRDLLKELAATTPPSPSNMSAMCYDVAPPPTRIDYLCPKCSERTLYDDSKSNRNLHKDNITEIVGWEIPQCRATYKELRKITGDAIIFDESEFCRDCTPDVSDPKLILHVRYKDGQLRNIEDIKSEDMQILLEFFQGKLMTTDGYGEESPLRDHLPRLQELFGVKL